MEITDKEKEIILELYPEYDSITEYEISSDGRYRVRLAKLGTSTQIIRQRAAVLLESIIGRRLLPDETVDHIDDNPVNDKRSNLQVLSRSENASKGSKNNKYALGHKQTEEHKRSGSKNGMAKLTNEQVIKYRELFKSSNISKHDICDETGLKYRAVSNMLSGISYKI